MFSLINGAAPAVYADIISGLYGVVFYFRVFISLVNLEFAETNDSDLIELRNCHCGM